MAQVAGSPADQGFVKLFRLVLELPGAKSLLERPVLQALEGGKDCIVQMNEKRLFIFSRDIPERPIDCILPFFCNW